MPRYLVRGTYTAEGTRGLIKGGGGTPRRAMAQELLRSMGGEIESVYFSFGDDDFVMIVQLPGNVSAAAISLAINATGAINMKTTPLLTPEEIDQAAQSAPDLMARRERLLNP